MIGNTQSHDRTGMASGSALAINVTSVERVLAQSALVGVGEYRCPVGHPQFAGGGPQTCPYIVFPRTSVRLTPAHWRTEVCTPNVASLYNIGDTYDRKPVSEEGDLSDWIAVSPDLLRDVCDAYFRGLGSSGDRIFQKPFVPVSSELYLAQRILFSRISEDPTLPMLAIEEYVVALVHQVARESTVAWGGNAANESAGNTRAQHAQLILTNDAKEIIATRYASQLTLQELARSLQCSEGYLCRTFKRATGFTLHGYSVHLRLRASLQMIVDSWMDLSGIAEHLGFANHSHFTDVFRRNFAMTPSAFAKSRSSLLQKGMHMMLDSMLANGKR